MSTRRSNVRGPRLFQPCNAGHPTKPNTCELAKGHKGDHRQGYFDSDPEVWAASVVFVEPLAWQRETHWQAAITGPASVLVVIIQRVAIKGEGRFVAMGIEGPPPTSPAGAPEPTLRQGMDLAFADHAHAVIGDYPALELAIEGGEAYAQKWAAGKRAEKCGCGEIQTGQRILPPRPKRKSARTRHAQ